MSPKRSDLILPSDILIVRCVSRLEERAEFTHPDIEFDIFIRHCFDVEADCGNCSDGLIELELV
jgi:hypothetical protein